MSEWQPISELPMVKHAMVGRWNGTGSGTRYWSEVRACWYLDGDKKLWTYATDQQPSPFYDDDGNYAEPTHFFILPEPPR